MTRQHARPMPVAEPQDRPWQFVLLFGLGCLAIVSILLTGTPA